MKRHPATHPTVSAAGRTARVLLAASACLILALPTAAAAQPQSGHGTGGHGAGGHGAGGGHAHGAAGPSSVSGGGRGGSHGGGALAGPAGGGRGPVGGFGGGPPAASSQFGPGHRFHGYDGSEQRDARGNFGDRRGFGDEFNSVRRFRHGGYDRPGGWYAHHWRHGEFLPSLFWTQDYWLLNYWLFGLSPPPYGYIWVRDDGDALLIDRATGEIVEVIYGVFY